MNHESIIETTRKIREQVHGVVVGQDDVLDELLLCLFCGGHGLLMGVPGLAKTLLVSTLSKTLNLDFSRIQFTPDLMPSDMTGTEVMEEDKNSGERSLRFIPGPVFANLILADEINRTPPKTQAALLEAMQENQVTAGGRRHELPNPFFVLATQNPIEQEGTYPLPEAQLDRFMFNILISYPNKEDEVEIVKRTTAHETEDVQPIISGDEVLEIQKHVRQTPVADHLVEYAIRLTRATRTNETEEAKDKPEIVERYVKWGAGPRASQFLILAAKAKALLEGSAHVLPEHIKSVAHPVLRHRILKNFNAEADGVTTDEIITALLEWISIDDVDPETRSRLDRVLN